MNQLAVRWQGQFGLTIQNILAPQDYQPLLHPICGILEKPVRDRTQNMHSNGLHFPIL